MKVSGIYKIQSKVKTERIYFGSAINIKKRWQEHIWHLSNNSHHNIKLQRHYNKYGEADLVFSIIIECPKENLLLHEQDLIDCYEPYFNIAISSSSPMLGRHHSEESKNKIGNANSNKTSWSKGLRLTQSHRDNIGNGNRGKIVSLESKEKMRISARGKTLTKEHKDNISRSLAGRKISEEQKQSISRARKKRINFKLTESHKVHIKEKMIEYWRIKRLQKIA